MRLVTASKLDLAFQCLHWSELDYPEESPGRKAVIGTAFHSLAATGEHGENLSPSEQAALEKMHTGWLKHGASKVPQDARFEVAYALAPNGTIRELGENIGRGYAERGARPWDICGSLDVVSGDRVIDWKTGQARVSAADSWQLRFGAIVADVPRAEFHYVSAAGYVKVDAAEYGDEQAAADFDALTLLAQRLQAKDTPATYGEHCDALYCPARKVCSRYLEVMGPLVAAPSKAQKRNTQPEVSMSLLSKVTTGRKRSPYFIALYGPEGIGKSSFAAGAPNPIFIGEPGGTDHLDVARLPTPTSLDEIHKALRALHDEKHDFQTLVIDTADYIEPLIWGHVCAREKKNSIEDFGYGKGYVLALDEWRNLMAEFVSLRRERGMHIVILAHSQLKNVRNPLGDDYEHYELKLHGKAAALLKESPNAVLFANYISYTDKDENTKRAKAYGDGSRLIYTEHRPAFDAKNRYGLPYELPLSWEDFDTAAQAGEPEPVERLLAEVETLLADVPEDIRAKAIKARDASKSDARKLAMLVDKLRGKIREQKAA